MEIAAAGGQPGRQITDLAEMNRLFTAWVENVYHRRVHSETGMAPLARWLAGAPFPVPAPADLAEGVSDGWLWRGNGGELVHSGVSQARRTGLVRQGDAGVTAT